MSQVEPGLSPETSQVKFIPREAGPYQVELTYDGVAIPGSPFSPTAYPVSDPSKVSRSDRRASVEPRRFSPSTSLITHIPPSSGALLRPRPGARQGRREGRVRRGLHERRPGRADH